MNTITASKANDQTKIRLPILLKGGVIVDKWDEIHYNVGVSGEKWCIVGQRTYVLVKKAPKVEQCDPPCFLENLNTILIAKVA